MLKIEWDIEVTEYPSNTARCLSLLYFESAHMPKSKEKPSETLPPQSESPIIISRMHQRMPADSPQRRAVVLVLQPIRSFITRQD